MRMNEARLSVRVSIRIEVRQTDKMKIIFGVAAAAALARGVVQMKEKGQKLSINNILVPMDIVSRKNQSVLVVNGWHTRSNAHIRISARAKQQQLQQWTQITKITKPATTTALLSSINTRKLSVYKFFVCLFLSFISCDRVCVRACVYFYSMFCSLFFVCFISFFHFCFRMFCGNSPKICLKLIIVVVAAAVAAASSLFSLLNTLLYWPLVGRILVDMGPQHVVSESYCACVACLRLCQKYVSTRMPFSCDLLHVLINE